MRRIYAFTLAEVLITLTIIAVISAMTIPSITQNTTSTQFKMQWRNTYANLKQTKMLIATEYDGWNKFLNTMNSKYSTHRLFLRDEFAKRMNVVKQCSTTTMSECWLNSEDIKTLDGTTPFYDPSEGAIILSNGTSVMFNAPNAEIWVDINGLNSPNVIGKDIFVLDNGFNPVGGGGSTIPACPTGDGRDCSVKYLYQ